LYAHDDTNRFISIKTIGCLIERVTDEMVLIDSLVEQAFLWHSLIFQGDRALKYSVVTQRGN